MKIAAPVAIDPDFWTGRRVLITGHTGFKGAWLSLWLQSLGADVSGLARAQPACAVAVRAGRRRCAGAQYAAADVRDRRAVLDALSQAAPEFVFHLAAQPTVRRSLRDPLGTYAVNVLGTVNVLDAVRNGRASGAPRAVVVSSTSDKCYENSPARTLAFRRVRPARGR